MSDIKTYKFLSNKPVKIKFAYDTGKKQEGDYGPYFSYKVEIDKQEFYINATVALADMIEKEGPLRDKTLTICKATEIGSNGKETTKWQVSNDNTAGQGTAALKGATPEQPEVDLKLIMAGCINTVAKAYNDNKITHDPSSIICSLFIEEMKRRR